MVQYFYIFSECTAGIAYAQKKKMSLIVKQSTKQNLVRNTLNYETVQ